MASPPLHVLVIGGGIGGLCLAQGLQAAGVRVTVYERNSAQAWLEGYRIHINPVGSQALHACLPSLLWDAFVASAGIPPAGLGFLTEHLQELVVIAEEFMSARREGLPAAHYPVSRLALRHLLLAGLDGVIVYEKTFEHYECTHEGRVVAHFSDGTSAVGDVLVGADGANSRVRQQFLPQAPRVETGAVGVGGKLLLTEQTKTWLPPQLARRLNLIMPVRRYCLFSAPFDHGHSSNETLDNVRREAKAARLDPDLLIDKSQNYLLWAFLARSDDYPADAQHFGGDELIRLVGRMLEGWHPVLQRVVAESDPASVSFNPFKASTLIASWKSTNVTLLGDAIHNMPPVGGFGGNMALHDAWSLTRTLTAVQQGRTALLPALAGYEAEMRRSGFAAVRAAVANTRQATSRNRLERLGARAWFRACNALPPLKRVFEEEWTRPMRQHLK